MRGTDERVYFWGRHGGHVAWYLVPAGLLVAAVVTRHPLPVAYALMTFSQVWIRRRGNLVLTPDGVEVGVFQRRRVSWSDVAALRGAPMGEPVRLVLADGSAVPLRGVVWYAWRAEGRGPRGSVQELAEYARGHGHDIPVTAP